MTGEHAAQGEASTAWKLAGAVLPYAGVLGGMLGFENGWVSILGYHAGMVAVVAASGRWGLVSELVRWSGTGSGPRAGARAWWAIELAAACALAGPAILVLWPWASLEGAEMGSTLAALGLEGSSWIAFIAYYLAVNPSMEELYWRGWWGERTAMLAPSDLLYTGYHAVVLSMFLRPGWIALAVAVLMGAAWTWRRAARATGGLAVPAATHTLADASIIAAALVIAGR